MRYILFKPRKRNTSGKYLIQLFQFYTSIYFCILKRWDTVGFGEDVLNLNSMIYRIHKMILSEDRQSD